MDRRRVVAVADPEIPEAEVLNAVPWAGIDAVARLAVLLVDLRHNAKIDRPELIAMLRARGVR